jgi:hypothetical protein
VQPRRASSSAKGRRLEGALEEKSKAAKVDLPLGALSRREKRYVSTEEEDGKDWTERRDGTVPVLSISLGLNGSTAEDRFRQTSLSDAL